MSNRGSIVPHNDKITEVKDSFPSNNSKPELEKVIVERIPLYEEDFDISKEIKTTQVYLEKRWINSTKKIEVPVKYEEMFINGREFDSFSHKEISQVFSKVKEKISEVLHHEQNEERKGDNSTTRQYPHDLEIEMLKDDHDQDTTNKSIDNSGLEQRENEKALALKPSETSTNTNQIQVSKEDKYLDSDKNGGGAEELVIPIWGEQIIINKQMIKLGEIVIKKTKTLEKRKLEVEVKKEKVTIKYPDGNKEEIM
ncbi:MAG TPA: hypothetical protein VD815_09365 [Candidatus Saccharimonadales bacterium]|nr:hypothetical protein [Candidatus Saccharimonadales bacterium]